MNKPFTSCKYIMVIACIFLTNVLLAQQKAETGSTIPTLEEALKDMQTGTRYNLKKVLQANGEAEFTSREDNPHLRAAYDYRRLANPATGKIPEGIREKELQYINSTGSHLQDQPVLFNRSGRQVNAIGDLPSSWTNRGPFNVGGRTRALALDINDEDRILAGGVSGGLWESTDAGATWTRLTPATEHPSITDIVQDPRVGFQDTWYYVTGERIGASQNARNGSGFFQGNGVYKSTDNGKTFTVLTATANLTPQSFNSNDPFDLNFGIVVQPTTGHIYVATFSGIHRSTDGGATFEEVLPGELDNISDIHVTSEGVLYATLDSDNNGSSLDVGGVFRSEDGAAGTWTNITPPGFPSSYGRMVTRTAPSNEDVLYLFAANTTSTLGHDFWKFTYDETDTDGIPGEWEDRTANLPAFGGDVGTVNSQGGYDLYVRVHPTDENLVFLGTTNIYRSFDGFATATPSDGWIAGYSPLNNVTLYTNHHPDQHNMVFLPSNPDIVITGHDGGLSRTENIKASSGFTEPVAWTSLNNGYLTTQVYALSFGPGNQIMAGFQDNSTWLTTSTSGTATWTDEWSGDGSYNAFSKDGRTRYVSSQNGNASRLVYASADSDAALLSTRITPTGSGGFLFVNPFELDPNNDEIMYMAGGTLLWRNDQVSSATTSRGWTALTNSAVPSGTISTIGISTIPANVVYIGTTNGVLLRIDNADSGNPTGVDIFTGKGLPVGNVSSIAVDPSDASRAIVTFSNYSIVSVWLTEDGGDTWTDISGNLEENTDGTGSGPSVRWMSIVGQNDLYLAGTSTGLYSTTLLDGSTTTWTQVDPNGIGNVVVEQIRSRQDGLVIIGTHGNGIYSGEIEVTPGVSVVNPLANITAEVNAADFQVDVSNIFASDALPALDIEVSVDGNSNNTLLSASLTGDLLTISLQPNEFGKATITLRGQDTDGVAALSFLTVTINPPAITTFPYTENFDNDGGDLASGWNITSTASYDWLIGSGTTPSGNTGPTGDNTTGTGFYVFTEASAPAVQGDQTTLSSRKLDLSSLPTAELEFSYHMFGFGTGSLDVRVATATDTTGILTITGQQQTASSDDFLSTTLSLNDYVGQIISVQFVATRGVDWTGDISVDDVEVGEALSNDLAVVSVTPDDLVFGTESVTALIRNEGSNEQSSYTLTYRVNSDTVQSVLLSTSILPGEEMEYTFATPFDFSAEGDYLIEVIVNLAGDEETDNNEVSQIVSREFFTGNYQLVQLNTPSFFDTHLFSFDGIDSVYIDRTGDGGRTFNEVTLEPIRISNGLPTAPRAYTFDLDPVNEDVLFRTGQATGLASGGVSIRLGPATEPGSYDPASDGEFSMTIRDHESSSAPVDLKFKVYKSDVELFVFEGTTSIEWEDASNWSTGRVPGIDDVVVLNTTSFRQPEIFTDVTVKDLIVKTSTFVTITSGSITITGELMNEGSMTVAAGSSVRLLGERSGGGVTGMTAPFASNGALGIFGIPFDSTAYTATSLDFDFLFDYDNNLQEFFTPAGETRIKSGKGYFGTAPLSPALLTGKLAWGSISTPVDLDTDGFHMVANPYGAAIDAAAFFADADNTANTTGTAYLWNDGGQNSTGGQRGGDYIAVNSLGAAGGPIDPGNGVAGVKSTSDFTGSFASFQGFFIEATQTGDVSFTPGMQVIGDNGEGGFFRTETENNSKIKIALQNNELYNDIIIGLVEGATTGEDYSLDAGKFQGNARISFYSVQDDKQYAIQALPSLEEEFIQTIDLGYDVTEAGEYQITVPLLENLEEGTIVSLTDHETGQVYNLNEAAVIPFSTEKGSFKERLSVTFISEPLSAPDGIAGLLQVQGTTEGLQIRYNETKGKVTIYDLQGRIMHREDVTFTEGATVIRPQLDVSRMYLLRVNDNSVKFVLSK